MDALHLFLIVFSYIFLCLSGLAFVGSLTLAACSRTKKGLLVLLIYAALLFALIAFVALCPGGAEAWTLVIFFTICIGIQFVWIGKLRHQSNRVLKWSYISTLITSGFLLGALISINSAMAFH